MYQPCSILDGRTNEYGGAQRISQNFGEKSPPSQYSMEHYAWDSFMAMCNCNIGVTYGNALGGGVMVFLGLPKFPDINNWAHIHKTPLA